MLVLASVHRERLSLTTERGRTAFWGLLSLLGSTAPTSTHLFSLYLVRLMACEGPWPM